MTNNFDWKKSTLSETAQSCDMRHDDKRYWFAVSETLREGEWQAMCNGVRLCKTFYVSPMEAKNCCEKWYAREVLGLTVNNG